MGRCGRPRRNGTPLHPATRGRRGIDRTRRRCSGTTPAVADLRRKLPGSRRMFLGRRENPRPPAELRPARCEVNCRRDIRGGPAAPNRWRLDTPFVERDPSLPRQNTTPAFSSRPRARRTVTSGAPNRRSRPSRAVLGIGTGKESAQERQVGGDERRNHHFQRRRSRGNRPGTQRQQDIRQRPGGDHQHPPWANEKQRRWGHQVIASRRDRRDADIGAKDSPTPNDRTKPAQTNGEDTQAEQTRRKRMPQFMRHDAREITAHKDGKK